METGIVTLGELSNKTTTGVDRLSSFKSTGIIVDKPMSRNNKIRFIVDFMCRTYNINFQCFAYVNACHIFQDTLEITRK